MKNGVLILALLLPGLPVLAQITAQGQGGKTVLWHAVGLEQQLGKRWVNKNVLAYSRRSNMDSWNPVQLAGVFTVREELEYRISKKFKASVGVFYAQRGYADSAHPEFLNELRFYPRIYHQFQAKRIRFSQYLRTDLRLFTAPGFKAWHKPFEFRLRYLMKMTVPVHKNNRHFMVFITEFLAATDEEVEPDGRKRFTRFNFTENRSSVFYRHHIPRPDMYFDIGVMNQMWRGVTDQKFNQTLLFQVDWVFVNPFKKF